MMNKIFGGMILLGIIIAAFMGNMEAVGLALVDNAKEAVNLVIVMLGVVSMWSGIMEIAKRAGISQWLAQVIDPVICFLFPSLKGAKGKTARIYIAENMAANVLGLGWAATPAGLKAMKELKEIQKDEDRQFNNKQEPGEASDAMCMFLVLNVSSLQLLPINIIAYRSEFGSLNPAMIVLPAIIATSISTLVAVIYGRYRQVHR